MPCLKLRSPHTPKALRGWVLVDALGMPRYWPTIWADVLRAGLEDSTRCRHLYAIDRLYLHFERQHGSDLLDVFLTDCQFDKIESGLTGFSRPSGTKQPLIAWTIPQRGRLLLISCWT